MKFKKYYLFLLLSIYYLFHSFRNLAQYFGIENFFTQVGHEFGVKSSNFWLNMVGLNYDVSQEIYYFFMELCFSIGLFLLFRHFNRKQKTQVKS